MPKVKGIGGIIFKAKNPELMQQWYARHLGVAVDEHGVWSHYWREKANPQHVGRTVWEVFPDDAENFEPSSSPFMINYRVDDLHSCLAELKAEGVQVMEEVVAFPFGKLGWCVDPEGNKVELWEPANEEGQEEREG